MPEPLTAHVLTTPAEWQERLVGTALDGAPLVEGLSAAIVVEDEDGVVVACWGIMTTVHVEGLWIAESHRGHPGVARALLSTTVQELQRNDVREVLTQSLTPEIDAMITKVGGSKVPGQTWVIPVRAL